MIEARPVTCKDSVKTLLLSPIWVWQHASRMVSTRPERRDSIPKRDLMKSIQDPRYLEIVARLRAAREHRGLSQAELATRVGKRQSYIAKVETCERRLDLLEALALCDVLMVSLEAIIPSALHHLLRSESAGGSHARDHTG
jgi:ribosome-binding protein aMBF1 (putative translation factor)